LTSGVRGAEADVVNDIAAVLSKRADRDPN
jgi:hypothetical protein